MHVSGNLFYELCSFTNDCKDEQIRNFKVFVDYYMNIALSVKISIRMFVCQDNKDSVMHIACRRKDFDMVKLFVESGADVDMRNVSFVLVESFFNSYEKMTVIQRVFLIDFFLFPAAMGLTFVVIYHGC